MAVRDESVFHSLSRSVAASPAKTGKLLISDAAARTLAAELVGMQSNRLKSEADIYLDIKSGGTKFMGFDLSVTEA